MIVTALEVRETIFMFHRSGISECTINEFLWFKNPCAKVTMIIVMLRVWTDTVLELFQDCY